MRSERVADLGDEAKELSKLAEAGIPLAHGWIVRLGDEPHARLEAVVRLALAEGEVARVRPLIPTRAASVRFERRIGTVPDIASVEEAVTELARLVEVLGAPDITASFGGSLGSLAVRVLACDRHPAGRAASADPVYGDPDEVSVWTRSAPAARWRIDRKTMRVSMPGEGLSSSEASLVADLADRAQLELGHPVDVEWCSRKGRFALVGVRPVVLQPTFGTGTWRRVALVAADEGTVSPLSIDALDLAFGRKEGPSPEPHVRRIYARPYRRVEAPFTAARASTDAAGLFRAASRAAQVASDVAAPLAAVRSFGRELEGRLSGLDAMELERLEDEALLAAIRDRQSLVADALLLLDRGRMATLAVLAAIEAAVGPLPRDVRVALAAPSAARTRKRVEDRLRRLAARLEQELGGLVVPTRGSISLQRRWAEMRFALADVRPLGIDAKQDAMGASDRWLLESVLAARARTSDAAERQRRDAMRRVIALARTRPLAPAREAIAGSLSLLAFRVARSKGSASEALASALLRLRRAASEAGRRLVAACVLDDAEDALYLHLGEIEDALRGEPGAYAARVRLRREDDARWARFEAPRRIEGRR